MDQMSNGRLGPNMQNDNGSREIQFVDDFSGDNHSERSNEMNSDNGDEDLLIEDDHFGDEDVHEGDLGELGGVHEGFEFDNEMGNSDVDEGDFGEEDGDDEDFDEQHIEGLFGANVHPALQALGRLQNLVPPAHQRDSGGNSEDGYEDDDSEGEAEGRLDSRFRIPFLEALRGTLVDPGMENIMRALRSDDDSQIISGLNELSELLLIPRGGLARAALIPVGNLSNVLVNLLRNCESIEVQVMTARAMSQLIDSDMVSGATRALIHAGVVPVMRRMFENVFYIDLIEQLIHVVKPVALLEPRLVLESECLKPCVGTLDFFNEYIQREIMAAIDACTKAVSEDTSVMAKDLLAIFPEHPNDNVIGAYSALIIAIAKLNESDFQDIATDSMWDSLISYMQPGTPHIARVARAVAHIAARCPRFVQSYDLIADLVYNIFVQGQDQTTADLFGKMISTSKDILFAGLKLLQVLLPLPPAIGRFSGPYRKSSSTPSPISTRNGLLQYAERATPLAITAYSASTNIPVRQLAILVVMQIVAVFQSEENFTDVAESLGLVQFVAQIIAEGPENLALVVGGLDIAWDLSSNPKLLAALSHSGITGDLEQYIGATQQLDLSADTVVKEPVRQFSPHDDLRPLTAYMSSIILAKVTNVQGSTSEDALRIVNSVKQDNYQVHDLLTVPLPDLTRAGLLEALEAGHIENHLSDDMVSLLQSALTRLEKFELKLTGSRAKSLEEVLSRLVFVRLTDRTNSGRENSWAVSVSAFVSVKSLEDFVRTRLHAHRPLNGAFLNAPQDDVRYNFWSGDNRLPRDISILKAIQGQTGVPVITYQRAGEDDEEVYHMQSEEESIVGPIATALRLLKTLAVENERRGEVVSWDKFRSSKLTAKLTRQLADVLAIAASMLPQWTFDTIHEYPFLYPLKIRLHFVQLTSFGMGRNLRLLRQMQQESHDNDDVLLDNDESNQILGRHKRQKFILSRGKILEDTLRLLERSSGNPAVVEVMFHNEEGTGKGPTQEFFALASKAMSDPSLNLWRNTPTGLYPESCPDPPEHTLRIFKGMGALVARALLDKRILDFHLNPAFFEAVLSEAGPSVEKLRRVDPVLAGSLDKLLDSSADHLNQMGLDFTLPGTDIELLPSGRDIEVHSENVWDYVNLICDRIVGSGIRKQVEAFRAGFSDTIPVSALKSFMLDELAALCGSDNNEDWSLGTLREAFTADHGYQMSSVPVQQLLNIISTFGPSERRKFLMFATGSPHLPVGGFKALTPAFTVVVKHPDNEALSVDRYLPSVMTCANYFKLPAYSSEEIMRRQLLFAMNEGSDAFLLS